MPKKKFKDTTVGKLLLGAENVVNSIFGPRSIFRICRGCK